MDQGRTRERLQPLHHRTGASESLTVHAILYVCCDLHLFLTELLDCMQQVVWQQVVWAKGAPESLDVQIVSGAVYAQTN